MSRIQARDFIDEQIPLTLQRLLPKAVGAAYDTVEKVTKATSFLQVESAVFGRGHLLAWAVDFEVFKLIRDGHWPYDCDWKPFHRPTGMYLRIDTGKAFATISQLTEMGEGSRTAQFRTNAALSNQPLLPFDTFAQEAALNERRHLVIGHGYQRLNFIIIGAPHPERPKSWIDRTDNILRRPPMGMAVEESPVPESGSGSQAQVEGEGIQIDLELAEHLKKKTRDEHG
jgi:hypothetical protein